MSAAGYPACDHLVLERDGGWLTVWINRPEVKNALSQAVFEELLAVSQVAREDAQLRGITIRGKGGIFSAGGDLTMFRDIFQGADVKAAIVAESSAFFGDVYAAIDTLPQVVVAAVEGAAIAGGLGLVAVADIAIVTDDARFAMTETTLGIPPAQIAPYVVRAIGVKAARRLMLSASRFSGVEAVALGIADQHVADAAALDRAEAEVRAQVMRCAPRANAVTKALIMRDAAVDAATISCAAAAYADCMLSPEGREGVSAFFEKRKPAWAESPGG